MYLLHYSLVKYVMLKCFQIVHKLFYTIFLFLLGPSFVKEMRNVSIAVGRDATIDCHVSNAEDYKVMQFFNIQFSHNTLVMNCSKSESFCILFILYEIYIGQHYHCNIVSNKT